MYKTSSRRRALALVAATALVVACDGSTPPPTSPSSPFISPRSSATYLLGWVADTVGRPIAGARVEIVDGPRAGTRTMSDESGNFAFAGGPTGAVTLRASRSDFVTTTVPTEWTWNPNQRTRVSLAPLEPPLPVEPGQYILTTVGDPTGTGWFGASCEGFPPELLRRTYEAIISPSSLSEGFQVRFSGATMTAIPGPSGYGFHFTQAGQFVGFELEPSFATGPAESLSEHRYLSISGNAPAESPATLTDDAFTIPFWGTFEYCRLTSPMTGTHSCNQVPAGQRLEYHVCSSPRSLLVFTRR